MCRRSRRQRMLLFRAADHDNIDGSHATLLDHLAVTFMLNLKAVFILETKKLVWKTSIDLNWLGYNMSHNAQKEWKVMRHNGFCTAGTLANFKLMCKALCFLKIQLISGGRTSYFKMLLNHHQVPTDSAYSLILCKQNSYSINGMARHSSHSDGERTISTNG